MVIVVAIALVRPSGHVLMARRPKGKSMAGLWEFPGGKVGFCEAMERATPFEHRKAPKAGVSSEHHKQRSPWVHDVSQAVALPQVETGETYRQALVREVKEELGVTVREESLQPIMFSDHLEPGEWSPDTYSFNLLIHLVSECTGARRSVKPGADALRKRPWCSGSDRGARWRTQYLCKEWEGEPRGMEGQELAWCDSQTLVGLQVPPADIPLIGPMCEVTPC